MNLDEFVRDTMIADTKSNQNVDLTPIRTILVGALMSLGYSDEDAEILDGLHLTDPAQWDSLQGASTGVLYATDGALLAIVTYTEGETFGFKHSARARRLSGIREVNVLEDSWYRRNEFDAQVHARPHLQFVFTDNDVIDIDYAPSSSSTPALISTLLTIFKRSIN